MRYHRANTLSSSGEVCHKLCLNGGKFRESPQNQPLDLCGRSGSRVVAKRIVGSLQRKSEVVCLDSRVNMNPHVCRVRCSAQSHVVTLQVRDQFRMSAAEEAIQNPELFIRQDFGTCMEANRPKEFRLVYRLAHSITVANIVHVLEERRRRPKQV